MSQTGRPWWPTRPLGFNMDGTHHEVEAPALRQVYYDVLKVGSLAGAARYLNTLNIVTARSGKPWTATHLRPVLLHARNAVIYVKIDRTRHKHGKGAARDARRRTTKCVPKSDRLHGIDPIVDEEVFRAVVRVLKDPKRRMYPEGLR